MTTGWGSLETERALKEESEQEGEMRWKARAMEREEMMMREQRFKALGVLWGVERRGAAGASSWWYTWGGSLMIIGEGEAIKEILELQLRSR